MSTLRFKVEPLSDVYIRLIDIIFALTITQGLIIYRELIVNPIISLKLGTLILVYLAIISSWIGYHKSIYSYPYIKSHFGLFRLFWDIITLVLYAYLVFVIQDLEKVLFGLFLVYTIYIVNGLVRISEWHDRRVSNFWLCIPFAMVFVSEWFILVSCRDTSYLSWTFIFISGASIICYRVLRTKLGYPTLKFVGVDIDGVLGEQVEPTLERLRTIGKGKNLKKSDITDWNFTIGDTNIAIEIEKNLLDPTFVENMPVIPNAETAMKKLHEKYHVVVVTSRPPETQKSTEKWLRNHFNFHELVNTRKVGKNCLGLDILIDDNLDNVKTFAQSGQCAILFSQPWNQNVKDKEFREMIKKGKIIRCRNWNEVMELLL